MISSVDGVSESIRSPRGSFVDRPEKENFVPIVDSASNPGLGLSNKSNKTYCRRSPYQLLLSTKDNLCLFLMASAQFAFWKTSVHQVLPNRVDPAPAAPLCRRV